MAAGVKQKVDTPNCGRKDNNEGDEGGKGNGLEQGKHYSTKLRTTRQCTCFCQETNACIACAHPSAFLTHVRAHVQDDWVCAGEEMVASRGLKCL